MRPDAIAYAAVIPAPFAHLGLIVSDGGVAGVDLLSTAVGVKAPSGPVARDAARRVTAYLGDPRTPLEVPLVERGTAFQRRVWAALRRIPTGAVCTYGELARALGTSPRAVGGACRHNPLPVFTPCHRVIASAGLGGYAGHTEGPELACKRWLLAHEGAL